MLIRYRLPTWCGRQYMSSVSCNWNPTRRVRRLSLGPSFSYSSKVCSRASDEARSFHLSVDSLRRVHAATLPARYVADNDLLAWTIRLVTLLSSRFLFHPG